MRKATWEQKRPAYAIDSIEHTLRVLHMLRDGGCVRITEVARNLGIAPSTAHRIMAMLVYQGFAMQDDSRKYLAGPALSAPVISSDESRTMIDVAKPVLRHLALDIGETTNLTIRVGVHARVLASVEAETLLRIGDRTGAVLPAHGTAGGKALLATEPRELVERLYRGRMPPPGIRRLSDSEYAELIDELDQVRRQGYALCHEEAQHGVAAFAVTVTAGLPRAVGTIAVLTPVPRLERLYRHNETLNRIRAAQSELSARLAGALTPTGSAV